MCTFMPVTEEKDLQAVKRAIFEEELFPHADALYNFAFHLTYNEENANDLVQETFLKAFRFIHLYERGTNAKAWLLKY